MTIVVRNLFRYPVKGLSAEPLDQVTLMPGAGLPLDRAFALARASTAFDPERPSWQTKRNFLMLMLNGKLAALETRFDDRDGTLTILNKGKQLARGDIKTPVGRAIIEDFFSAYLGAEAGGKPRLIAAPADFMFSDHRTRVVSIVNLASIGDLERAIKAPVDPLRFRANVYIDGLEPWMEFGWMGREIVLGNVRLKVEDRIQRCAATNVDPGTGERDMNIPKILQQTFGHIDMGIYAEVTGNGAVRVGDTLDPEPTV